MLREEHKFISSHGQDVLSQSTFFSRKDIGSLFLDDAGGDIEDVRNDSDLDIFPPSRTLSNLLSLPEMDEMKTRKSCESNDPTSTSYNIQLKTPRSFSDAPTIQMRIDGLLKMFDSENDCNKTPTPKVDSMINIMDVNDIKQNEEKIQQKTIHKTSMRKGLVSTPYGNGVIVDSNDKFYFVELDNMVSSISKSECRNIGMDANNIGHLRGVLDIDLNRVYELEVNGYPSDEAASREKLFYRFIFAKEYFMAFILNGTVIGFVCGTKTKESTLTDETMSIHDKDGQHLCIHSVVIGDKYQRRGYGSQMVKEYVKSQIGASWNASLLSLRLVCKKHLISFYANCGFKLIGESDLEHGKDKWYEMKIDILRE